MAYQLEVIKFRDIVPISKISRFVPNLPELTIEIVGDDFSSVEEVLINEMRAPEFIILNKNTLWAQLPVAAQQQISTVEVLSSNFTKSLTSSKIQFKLGDKTRAVSGILKLVQLFTKWMLQSPGSDVFDPSRGGGLQQLIGTALTSRRMEPVMSAITRSVGDTVSQIRTVQTGQSGLPMNERLLSATVTSINVFEAQMEARAVIDIQNMAGENALSSLQL